MVSRDDIVSFLRLTEMEYAEIDDGLWLVPVATDETGERPGIVVSHEPPVVVFRSGIRDEPPGRDDQFRLYRTLLELNAADLIHGAYGLEDGEVVLADTLELENLDFSEFRASLESLALAVTSHWNQLTAG